MHENSDEKTQTTKSQTRKLGGENSDDEKRKLRRENSDEIYKDIAASAAKENVAEGDGRGKRGGLKMTATRSTTTYFGRGVLKSPF